MAHALASEMVRKSLDVFLAGAESSPDSSQDQARELLASHAIPLFVLERLWQVAQDLLKRGVEVRRFISFLEESIEVFDLGLRAFRTARDRVSAAELGPEERETGVSELDAATFRATELRDDLLTLLRRLQTPPREVDIGALPGGREAAANPTYIGLDDFLKGLHASENR